MSKYPKTDENAFNNINFNSKSRAPKAETFAQGLKRLANKVEADKIRLEKAKTLKAIMATKPVFINAYASQAIVAEKKWLAKNEAAIAACK